MNADTTSENVAGETESIEDCIVALQTKNFESAYFVPTKDLEELLSKPSIQDILNRCGIEAQHRDETSSIILSGARKIFSILILMKDEALIRKFIEHDQFQFKDLDAKLPLSESALQRIIGNGPAKRFYRKQWMFVSPYFRNDLRHRILEHDVVLPFIDSSFVGRGGFGTVSEVTLHPRHQGIASTAGVSKIFYPRCCSIGL
jgi:hypothetical protein